MEEKRPLRRRPEDHHFWSLMMLAVTVGRLPAGDMGSHEGALLLPSGVSNALKIWQRHALACSGYIELGMFDDAEHELRIRRGLADHFEIAQTETVPTRRADLLDQARVVISVCCSPGYQRSRWRWRKKAFRIFVATTPQPQLKVCLFEDHQHHRSPNLNRLSYP